MQPYIINLGRLEIDLIGPRPTISFDDVNPVNLPDQAFFIAVISRERNGFATNVSLPSNWTKIVQFNGDTGGFGGNHAVEIFTSKTFDDPVVNFSFFDLPPYYYNEPTTAISAYAFQIPYMTYVNDVLQFSTLAPDSDDFNAFTIPGSFTGERLCLSFVSEYFYGNSVNGTTAGISISNVPPDAFWIDGEYLIPTFNSGTFYSLDSDKTAFAYGFYSSGIWPTLLPNGVALGIGSQYVSAQEVVNFGSISTVFSRGLGWSGILFPVTSTNVDDDCFEVPEENNEVTFVGFDIEENDYKKTNQLTPLFSDYSVRTIVNDPTKDKMQLNSFNGLYNSLAYLLVIETNNILFNCSVFMGTTHEYATKLFDLQGVDQDYQILNKRSWIDTVEVYRICDDLVIFAHISQNLYNYTNINNFYFSTDGSGSIKQESLYVDAYTQNYLDAEISKTTSIIDKCGPILDTQIQTSFDWQTWRDRITPEIISITITNGDITTLLVNTIFLLQLEIKSIGNISKEVIWSSDNPSVATVDQLGKVIVLTPGFANITATSVADSTKFDTIQIDAPAVLSLQISDPDFVPYIGQTIQFTHTITTAGSATNEVTWSVSDETIASVDQTGLVTILSEGEFYVKVTSDFDTRVCDVSEVIIAQEAFIATFTTTNPNENVMIPFGNNFNVSIDWDDGSVESNLTENGPTHTYLEAGTYEVKVTGSATYLGIYNLFLPNNSDWQDKIISVIQWGNLGWTDFTSAFAFTTNPVTLPSNLPSTVTSLEAMFTEASSFNDSNISAWDTSNVTNMKTMFLAATSFNQPINDWDVSSVETMSQMFHVASSFNQNIEDWDFSGISITNGLYLFLSDATSFSSDNYDALLNRWNEQVASNKITLSLSPTISSQFSDPISVKSKDNLTFINNWTITDLGLKAGSPLGLEFVTTTQLQEILVPLRSITSVNIDWGDDIVETSISANNPTHTYTEPGTYVVKIFGTASYLGSTPPDVRWTQNVIGCLSFGDIGLTSLAYSFQNVVANVEMPSFIPTTVNNLSTMFTSATNFNRPLNSWNTGNITNMYFMFRYTNFNQPLNDWDVSSCTIMSAMFNFNNVFNQPLNNWDVSNVTNMQSMFYGCSSFNQNIEDWNVSNVTNMQQMFMSASVFNQPLNNWDVSNVTNMALMFMSALQFNQNISNWNVSSVTNMERLFQNSKSFNQPIGTWNVSNVNNMIAMFFDADDFDQNISTWDFSGLNSNNDLNEFFVIADGLSPENYNPLLIAWSNAANAGTIFSPLSPNMGGSKYSTLEALAARTNLIDNYGWTIVQDGGPEDDSLADGVSFWIDASDENTIVELSGSVSQWNDKSGNNYNVTQAVSAQQPKTGTRTLNGLNVIEFDGNDWLRNATPQLVNSSTGEYTAIAVALADNFADNQQIANQQDFFGLGETAQFLMFNNSGDLRTIGWTDTGANNDLAGFTGSVGTPYVLSAVRSIAELEAFVNKTTDGPTPTTGNSLVTFASKFTVGASSYSNFIEELDGYIAEILIFSRALNTADRESVEDYLANKWNIIL